MAGKSLTQKTIETHLVEGAWTPGKEIAVRVDQVLLQDATGTQACQQLERLTERTSRATFQGPEKILEAGDQPFVIDESLHNGAWPLLQFEQFDREGVRVPLAVQYVDHNIHQIDERNADDHAFLFSFARRHGIWYSPLGNGICHQVHVERFAVPGAVIVGADSHTTTSGAMGALALGVGGLEAATILAGYPLWIPVPKVVRIELVGRLQPWVSATDIILELLRRFKVTWGISVAGIGGLLILEFTGEGAASLRLTERSTIANMAAELNATAIFPADHETLKFLEIQRRASVFRNLAADKDAEYDDIVVIDLAKLEPLVAKPYSPDNVVPVREVEGTPVAQVAVGSSVNSWYEGMAVVAKVLRGCRLPFVEGEDRPMLLQLLVSPGSRQIANVLERQGLMQALRDSGARILESACGPCVGMGGAPASGVNSLRTMNRNFPGRSGTKDDKVWLASPETAAATALKGVITDPRILGVYPRIGSYRLKRSDFTDHLLIRPLPAEQRSNIVIIRGPHIKPPSHKESLPESLKGEIVARFGDHISTGSISPDGVIVMGKRSNIGDIARHTFEKEMPSSFNGMSDFYLRARDAALRSGGGFVVAGKNYGQGSSREVAAMVMVELGIHAIFAKSFARIHRRNLIDQGILPLMIDDEVYDALLSPPFGEPRLSPWVKKGQIWILPRVRQELQDVRQEKITLHIESEGRVFPAHTKHRFSERERCIVIAGGLINYLKQYQR